MRKLAIVVAAALVAALAAPALAANLQLSGSMESSLTWRQQQWLTDEGQPDADNPAGVSASTILKLQAGLGTPENGVRAGIELSPLESTKQWGPQSSFGFEQLSITKAFLEANGQLWQGSPNTTARLGSLEVGYSPYIGTFEQEGFSLSGIGYGPVWVAGFVGRDAEPIMDDDGNVTGYNPPFTVAGGQLRAEMMGVSGRATVVHIADSPDWEVAASASPMPWMTVGGTYARMGEGSQPSMSRLDVQANVLPNLAVTAAYRNVDQAFDPRYNLEEYDPDDDTQRVDWLWENTGERGVVVGMRTVQFGIDVQASLDNYHKANVLNRDGVLEAKTSLDGFQLEGKTEVSLANGFAHKETTMSVAYPMVVPGMFVTPKYAATVSGAGVAHELSAEATVDAVPQLPGIGIEARVKRAEDSTVSYGADVEYTAPNGLATGVHYDSAKGAWVNAGLSAEF